ncbi:MAG: transglycosylase domain-containing protein [Deltaproteobacteria bacterium]|nr:transglycosylase domain-containing protein [Deltaproteobacteria bacterium]
MSAPRPAPKPLLARALQTVRAKGPWGLGVLALVWLCWTLTVHSHVMISRDRFVPTSDGFSVTDRHGATLRAVRRDGIDRRWVPLDQIPRILVDAVIAAEDQRFRSHNGVDRWALARAVRDTLTPGHRRSGGSTLTQQLVKRVYGRRYGALSKFGEILRAQSLERIMSKDEILEQYLNRLPYSDEIEGVARACESYFGHDLSSLSAPEAALLAAIPRAPTLLDPRRARARALERSAWVLTRMHATGAIDHPTLLRSLAEEPHIANPVGRPWFAARFVDRVLTRETPAARGRGGSIRTSLDLSLQQRTESLARAGLVRMRSQGARNAAAVVVANATGEVLAYVAAADEQADGGSLDLLDAPRQPGSTLKPFAYELFFERGGNAATVLDDVQLSMTGARGEHFVATDYDGHERGPVSARTALAASLNLAALDVARRVRQDPLAQRLRALGFRGVATGDLHGGALVLGGVGVRALELVDAYVTLARWGTRVPLVFAPSEGTDAGISLLNPSHARITWDILQDPHARREGFGDDLQALAPGLTFALKTGTSPNWRDAWCAVMTDRVTVLVWLGDPAGRAMAEVSGFRAAAPMAVQIAHEAHTRALTVGLAVAPRPSAPWATSEVCTHSGLRAGARCTHRVTEHFARGELPTAVCDQHEPNGDWVVPARLRAWALRATPGGMSLRNTLTSTHDSPAQTLLIREPRDGARWLLDPRRVGFSAPLRVTLAGAEVIADAWELDGTALASARWTPTEGTHTLVAVRGGQRSAPAQVTVTLAR